MSIQCIQKYLHTLHLADLNIFLRYLNIKKKKNIYMSGGGEEKDNPTSFRKIDSNSFTREQIRKLSQIILKLNELRDNSGVLQLNIPIDHLENLLDKEQYKLKTSKTKAIPIPELFRQNTDEFDPFQSIRTQKRSSFKGKAILFNTKVELEEIGNTKDIEEEYGSMQCLKIKIEDTKIRLKKKEIYTTLVSIDSKKTVDFYIDNHIFVPDSITDIENNLIVCKYTLAQKTGQRLYFSTLHNDLYTILPNKVLWKIIHHTLNACLVLFKSGFFIHSLKATDLIRASGFPNGERKYFVTSFSDIQETTYNLVLKSFIDDVIIKHLNDFSEEKIGTFLFNQEKSSQDKYIEFKKKSSSMSQILVRFSDFLSSQDNPIIIDEYYNLHILPLYRDEIL